MAPLCTSLNLFVENTEEIAFIYAVHGHWGVLVMVADVRLLNLDLFVSWFLGLPIPEHHFINFSDSRIHKQPFWFAKKTSNFSTLKKKSLP